MYSFNIPTAANFTRRTQSRILVPCVLIFLVNYCVAHVNKNQYSGLQLKFHDFIIAWTNAECRMKKANRPNRRHYQIYHTLLLLRFEQEMDLFIHENRGQRMCVCERVLPILSNIEKGCMLLLVTYFTVRHKLRDMLSHRPIPIPIGIFICFPPSSSVSFGMYKILKFDISYNTRIRIHL